MRNVAYLVIQTIINPPSICPSLACYTSGRKQHDAIKVSSKPPLATKFHHIKLPAHKLVSAPLYANTERNHVRKVILNRPGEARAVLQTPLSLFH